MGKMHWVGAALTGLLVVARQMLPVLLRLLPFLGQWRAQASTTAGKKSEVSARLIKMTLDHDNGELSGVVLEGAYKDWLLSELDRSQLDALLKYCQQEDSDSAQLLTSYMDQRFPEDDHQSERESSVSGANTTGLSRSEALAILGLSEEASEADIIAAHRTLIQKLHPDRGGNDYLAAKINEAKDFLLR